MENEQIDFNPWDTPKSIDAVLHFLNAKWYENLDDFLSHDVDWFAIPINDILPRERLRDFIHAIKDKSVQVSVLEFLAKFGNAFFRDRERERLLYEERIPEWGKPTSQLLKEIEHEADMSMAAFEQEIKLQLDSIKTSSAQQETDTRVLLHYIVSCADSHNLVQPMLVLKEAIALLNNFRENPDDTKTAWDYIKKAKEDLELATKKQYWRQTPGYQVAAAMYILMRVDGFADIREEAFANEVRKILQERHNFNFDQDLVEMTIVGMKKAKEMAPPSINPFDVIDELVASNNVSFSDWLGFLTMLNKMMFLIGRVAPHYMVLHMFLHRIPDTMRRVDVLGHLQDAAEKNWPEEQAKDFVTQAGYLVHIYTRLHMILINSPVQHIWKERPDMDELTMFIRDIRPKEMVAIAQSIFDARRVVGQRVGMVQHILTHSKYLDKLLTIDGSDFCKNLYMAHGFCLLMKAGKEDFRELPTIDNLDCEFRNACFDTYIDLRIIQIKEQLKNNNRRLYPANDEEAYSVLCKSLDDECAKVVPNAQLIWADARAQDSMVTTMQLLARYTHDKHQKLLTQTKQQETLAQQIIMNFNAPVEQNIANVEHMDVHMDKDGQVQVMNAEQVATPQRTKEKQEQKGYPLPEKDKYGQLVKWLEQEKQNGNDHYAEASYNRSQMCRNLLKIIGWEPNQDSLRKAQCR